MLTQADIKLLDFEEAYPRHTGLKVDQIRHRLGMSAQRYYERLGWLSGRQEAIDLYPRVCARAQRRAKERRLQRQGFDRWVA
jgi:hypothetical protein